MSLRNMQLRPWAEFFEFARFQIPPKEEFEDQLNVNLVYYQANYLIVIAVCMLYVCIARPVFILAALLIIGSGYYLFVVRTIPIIIAGRTINKKEQALAFFTLSLLIILFVGGSSSAAALFVSATLILLHCSFRARSLKARGATFIDVWRGSTPLGGAIRSELDEQEGDEDEVDEENPRSDEIKKEQAKFRSQFRASMRAKYLKKKD